MNITCNCLHGNKMTRCIEVVYSPVCEATGAMIGRLKRYLMETDTKIQLFSFENCPERLKSKYKSGENCFIDVFYNGDRIDTVPLHQEKIYKALGITLPIEQKLLDEEPYRTKLTRAELKAAVSSGEVTFLPITCNSFLDEMSMCLNNYPFGNPEKEFHNTCIQIKKRVFEEVWSMEEVAGIYAKYKENVIGLLEVMPREILKKYGYMTGTSGDDCEYMSVGCYEVGYGIPRVDMIGLLMEQLQFVFSLFHRRYIEGVGICDWNDGFNPYWVYEKFGFQQVEKLSDNVIVMRKRL